MDQLILGASITQPRFSGKPADCTQHEIAWVTSNDEPPVNSRALDDRLWGAELPILPDDKTDQRTQSPREREAIPAIASSNPFEIGVETIRFGTKRGATPRTV